MNSKVQYWLDISLYDLETAYSMFETKRFLYVAFMCHQSIEKILKAYWQMRKNELPPKTHNLSFLLIESGLADRSPEGYIDFIEGIEPLNIEIRYPSYREELLKTLTEDYCKNILNKSKEVHSWIQTQLYI